MKNYIGYFIPKYLNASGPLTGLEERNGVYYVNGQVVGETPLAAKDPLLSLWVEGVALGKPLEWAGRGLWAGAKFVAPKTMASITKGINYFKHYIKPKRHKAIIGSEESAVSNISAVGPPLPNGVTPNYLGDHLALAKERLANGGYERIGNPSGTKEFLLKTQPTPNDMAKLSARTGIFYDTAKPTTFTKELAEELSKLYGKNIIHVTPESLLAEYLSANNVYTAHEFEHFVHIPNEHLSEAIVDLRYIPDSGTRMYFRDYNNSEIAARFGLLKNYFGLKNNEPVTKEMWEYVKQHYIKDTGINNNMSEFFNLHINDLQGFLDWGNKNAISIAAPVGARKMIMKNENN